MVTTGPPIQKKGRGSWRLLCTCLNLIEGQAFILNGGIKDSLGKPLVFKFHNAGSHGTTRKAYQCASHEKCPVLVRTVLKGGSFVVQSKVGLEHGKVEATKSRNNAALTKVQEAELKKSINEGSKPAAILSGWSAAVLKKNPHARKRKKGGLAGKYTCI